ncbi:MAG: hypothetical protein CSA96_02445 [Bacteroidetes bacterium]|nr:MAG: hypothetical protein CSA96_02445 [Bacteroidota bacterium]
MRLLILNYEYPPLGGGAGVCSRYQAEGLARLGHEVTVLTTWFRGEQEESREGGLQLIRLRARRKKPYRSNPLEMLSWVRKSRWYIKTHRLYERTDLVLAHFSIPGGLVALPLKWRRGIPYLLITHGQDIPWFNPRELFAYHLLFYLPIRWICRGASHISVLSEERLRDLNRILRGRKQPRKHIIPNGCDTNFFRPGTEKKDREVLRVLFTGRMTRQKDPFTLLKSLQILKQKGIPFTLDIVGNGPLLKKMQHYTEKHGLSKELSYSGWVGKQELLRKYQQSHLMVISSLDEGMSLAMIEALSTGLYVVTTPVSGSSMLIRERLNGERFPFRDAARLAAILERYYRDKVSGAEALPLAALEEIRKEISWDHYVMAYHHLVQS